jgi:hypothetical protein
MESLWSDKDVWSSTLSIGSKWPKHFIRQLDRSQIFTGISRGCFPWGNYGMANGWRVRLVGQQWVSAHKGHNFWSDRGIALKFLQRFRETVFRGVYTECLLSEKDVWSTEQEYPLKRAITFDPTVWSLSKFYWGCFRCGSCGIAVQWEWCLIGNLEYRLKRAITFYPTVGSRLNFYRGFQRLFLVGYIRNAYSVTRMSGRPNKNIRWKGP